MIASSVLPILQHQIAAFSKIIAFPITIKFCPIFKIQQFKLKESFATKLVLPVVAIYAIFLTLHGSIYLANGANAENKIIIGIFSYFWIIVVGIQTPFFDQAQDFAILLNMQLVYEKSWRVEGKLHCIFN